MRLIDADELLKYKTDHEMISTHYIYNAPTVDKICGYPIDALTAFAIYCRTSNIEDEDLKTFANNYEKVKEYVMEEMKKSIRLAIKETIKNR